MVSRAAFTRRANAADKVCRAFAWLLAPRSVLARLPRNLRRDALGHLGPNTRLRRYAQQTSGGPLKIRFHCMAPQRGGQGHHRLDRLSCRRFAANAVRLQLHALAHILGNFLRTLAVSDEVQQWSMTTLRQRLAKIGARIVRHGRLITNQITESCCLAACFGRSWPPLRHGAQRRLPDVEDRRHSRPAWRPARDARSNDGFGTKAAPCYPSSLG
jgi:hypothetical protein